MHSQSLHEQLATVLCQHFELDREKVTPEASLDDLELDSLALAELLLIIEESTGARFPATIEGIGPQTTLAQAAEILTTYLVDEQDTPKPAGGTAEVADTDLAVG